VWRCPFDQFADSGQTSRQIRKAITRTRARRRPTRQGCQRVAALTQGCDVDCGFMTEPLAGPTLVGWRASALGSPETRSSSVVADRLAILGKRFHRFGEPALIFPYDIEVRRGIAHTFAASIPACVVL